MATPTVPSPKKRRFCRNYDELLRRAEEQRARALEMVEEIRVMRDIAAEMREEPGLRLDPAPLD